MIDRFIRLAIARRTIVIAITLLVAAYGYFSWTRLSIEAYPDIADVTSQVVTQAPGLAAEEVEQQITIPLERELNGTPGLAVMRSRSTFGLSLITIVFKDGTEDYFSRQRVAERIADAELPEGVSPGLDPLTSPVGEFYRYTLESDRLGLRELSEIQRWKVIPALRSIAGVAGVNNFGGVTTEYQLDLDPAALARFGLSLGDITKAIQDNNSNFGGSVITRGELGMVVRGIGAIRTLDDLGAVVVASRGGSPVLVRDLGRIRLSQVERYGVLGKDDHDDTISGIVTLLRFENPSAVLDGVHAKVDQLNRELAPQGVRIVPYLDRSELVDLTVHKVSHTVFLGIGLVLMVLMLFLGSVRSALIVASVIPLAMLIAFILMHFTGVPANLLSLGAIDFGIIVDGAIVMMDAILRRRERSADGVVTQEVVEEAASVVARPILFAGIIIITAYLPLFAFERVEAKLFTPMAFTVGFALFGAFLLALTLVPALATFAFRKPGRVWSNPVLAWLDPRYRAALGRVIHRPRLALIALAAAFVAVTGLGATVGRDFLPYLDEGSIWLQVQLPSGISLQKGREMARELRDVAREFPEVSYAVTQLGRNDEGTDPWTPSHIEASIGLKPYSEWGGDKQALIRRMSARFNAMPGFEVGFTQPMIDGVYDKIAGAHSALVVKVYSDDLAYARAKAEAIARVLGTVRGSADIALDQEPPLPQIVIRVDRAAAARYGINVADINDLISIAVGGGAVSQVYDGERRYSITVRANEDARNSPEALGRLTLTAPGGALVPLSAVVSIALRNGESTITRENNQRHVTVRLDYRDRDLSSFLAEARAAIAAKVPLDARKAHVEWGGQFENQQRAQSRLLVIIGAMLATMALVLYIAFGKLRHVLLILGTVPLATLGGLVALHLTGVTLNVASAVGFITLFGVAVQNAIIMVANLNRRLALHDDEALAADPELIAGEVVMGAGDRLRAVLMTATVATAGMLPAALATGVGSDVQRSLAIVVVGGLLIATLLTLFIIPALYAALERRARKSGAVQAAPFNPEAA
ncbi:CusA/CzcA family heavy metal efflux RND transporter [Brevundimonas diminuta]|uniref:efflux RND transporter permease subunit n=1 Tax=Brevundimonas diminuta TaxID=293 RepID=UPI0022AF3EE6|nr:CusA/CzcA family heavy metal efflux RND transporter [Brevundimonas diminuta]MCZ4107046.1 CusA/CzcA family heavy metal efflux RND transporter [Brevundimonas diminuta]